jgi:hypothetical protein
MKLRRYTLARMLIQFLGKLTRPPFGPLKAGWFSGSQGEMKGDADTIVADTIVDETVGDGERKEYVYDEEEDGEIQESEGRWKR